MTLGLLGTTCGWGLDGYQGCVWGGHAPRSVFDEDIVKAGCLDDVLGGRDALCAGLHPDGLLMRIKPPYLGGGARRAG